MISGYANKETRAFDREGKCPAHWRTFAVVLRRKLDLIEAAKSVADLRFPPSNRLEKLVGDRAGQWSIRVNKQWRVCFVWADDNTATHVEVVDYH